MNWNPVPSHPGRSTVAGPAATASKVNEPIASVVVEMPETVTTASDNGLPSGVLTVPVRAKVGIVVVVVVLVVEVDVVVLVLATVVVGASSGRKTAEPAVQPAAQAERIITKPTNTRPGRCG